MQTVTLSNVEKGNYNVYKDLNRRLSNAIKVKRLEKTNCIQILDKKGDVIFFHRFDENVFNRIQRLFELISDEDALITLDEVIKGLEAPKLELANRLSKYLTKNGEMTKFLEEALTAIPIKQLKDMEKRLTTLKMRREPGGDCLIIENGKQSYRLHL